MSIYVDIDTEVSTITVAMEALPSLFTVQGLVPRSSLSACIAPTA